MTDLFASAEASSVGVVASGGRYIPYPAYKDSGVEWLGMIPVHWDVKRLKRVATWNDEVLPEWTEPDLELIYVDIGGVDARDGVVEKEHLTFEYAPTRARRVVRDGDVIISTVRTYLRAIASIVDPEPGLIVSTGFAVIRPRDIYACFVAYAVRAPYFVDNVVANSVGVSYPAINANELVLLPVVCPTDSEQRAITAFLDCETAKLDALVAKKERLIELLQEKRTALITRAVTKGLDPDVPMKDSGVEWLGEIPAHWNIKQLRWAITFQRGHDLPSEDRDEGDVPIVSSSGVSSNHSRAIAEAPGIVTGRYGTIGQFHLMKQRYWPLNTTLYSTDLHGSEPRFLRYMLIHMRPLFLLHAVKSAVPGVDRNDIHADHTALPNRTEQNAIADYLEQETAKIDALVVKVREAVERLKELRTALISATVTGKIDVRETSG